MLLTQTGKASGATATAQFCFCLSLIILTVVYLMRELIKQRKSMEQCLCAKVHVHLLYINLSIRNLVTLYFKVRVLAVYLPKKVLVI